MMQGLAFTLVMMAAVAASLLITVMAGLSVMAFDAPGSGREPLAWALVIGTFTATIVCWLCLKRADTLRRFGRPTAGIVLLLLPIGLAGALLLWIRS